MELGRGGALLRRQLAVAVRLRLVAVLLLRLVVVLPLLQVVAVLLPRLAVVLLLPLAALLRLVLGALLDVQGGPARWVGLLVGCRSWVWGRSPARSQSLAQARQKVLPRMLARRSSSEWGWS